jgi:hypothetical protein
MYCSLYISHPNKLITLVWIIIFILRVLLSLDFEKDEDHAKDPRRAPPGHSWRDSHITQRAGEN